MLAKKEDETVMQLKKVTSKATEELPKQDRKQQVQESARKQGGKKTSGLSVVHLSGYVKVSSATLMQI